MDPMDDSAQLPPFLRCPLEIRLQIYRHLLLPPTSNGKVAATMQTSTSYRDYHEYERAEDEATPQPQGSRRSPRPVLSFRNEIPTHFNPAPAVSSRRRASYKIRSDRFRARCVDVTYRCVDAPAALHAAILGVSRQVHDEAARVLYGGYCFDFDTHVEAVEPFLADLTPRSRSYVRHLSLVKKALPYDRDFDRCEWSSMCTYLAASVRLSTLSLGVVSGKPAAGWDMVEAIPEDEFGALVTRHKRDEMEWVRDLIAIQGLQGLHIRPCIEHCPPPGSNAMMFFVAFSASVAKGFSNYLRKQMIVVT